MPLSVRANELLKELAEEASSYTLVGLLMDPATGEIGTFSSHYIPPGVVVGFLQRGTEALVSAMREGQLEAIDGTAGTTAQSSDSGEGYVN